MTPQVYDLIELLKAIQEVRVVKDFPLKNVAKWKVGGSADLFCEPLSKHALIKVVETLKQFPDIPSLFIGDASNLLFDDSGFKGIVVKLGEGMSTVTVSDNYLICDSGVWVPKLAHIAYKHSLSGLEHICGIPGRLGGLIYMNGGSNRKSISDSLEKVELLTHDGMVKQVEKENLNFFYRTSPFQENNDIILGCELKLDYSCKKEIRREMLGILANRRRKFPRKLPNCGSVFASNPSMYSVVGPPGKAIENVGLKGIRIGGAQISDLHANFIVNINSASSNDILELIQLAQGKVYKETGFLMESEVRYVFPDGRLVKADEVFKKI